MFILAGDLFILIFSMIKTNNKVRYNTGIYCTHFEVGRGNSSTTKNNTMTTLSALESKYDETNLLRKLFSVYI